MFFCKNTSLLTSGSSTHKSSADARTGIVRCPSGARTESYYINLKEKSSGARPMCANAGWAPFGHPADVILPSLTLPNAVRALRNFE